MEIIKSLIYDYWKNAIIFILLLFIFCSCGTRKLQKINDKEEIKTEQTSKVDNNIETKKEIKTDINDESNELEITPIDTSKVLIINGKTFKNAKVKIINRKLQTNTLSKENTKDKSQKTNNVKTDIVKTNNVKNLERKSNPFLPLLWLLIPIIGYLIWKYKYKLIGL